MLLQGWTFAIRLGAEGRFPNRPYGNAMWGPHLFVLFVSGGSCLELIRFGNRIREGLIDFVPEID